MPLENQTPLEIHQGRFWQVGKLRYEIVPLPQFAFSGLKRGAQLRGLRHQIGQSVAIQHIEERRGGFIEHAFQTAGGKKPAWLIVRLDALNDRVGLFAQTNDLSQVNFFRRPRQSESSANSAMRIEITFAAQLVNNLHQMMPRNPKRSGHFIDRHTRGAAQSGKHQHPNGIIRVSAELHG